MPAGKATIRFEFAYDGGRPGAGGTGTILVNGKKVARRSRSTTRSLSFSRLTRVPTWGTDAGTPVTDDYKERDNKFTGKIHKVTVELK